MVILHQDTDIILLNLYEWTGEPDGIYLKARHYSWMMSTIGNQYRVLLDRKDKRVIQIENEFYSAAYLAIEPSLVGDVLILGLGLATLSNHLTTGSSWLYVEKNEWLYNNISGLPGTKVLGDAEDETFLATLGLFDTILIDFPRSNEKKIDYEAYLNVGGTVIEMTI